MTHGIEELESSVQNQHSIDKAYDDFCSSVKRSMSENLDSKVKKKLNLAAQIKNEGLRNNGGIRDCQLFGTKCA